MLRLLLHAPLRFALWSCVALRAQKFRLGMQRMFAITFNISVPILSSDIVGFGAFIGLPKAFIYKYAFVQRRVVVDTPQRNEVERGVGMDNLLRPFDCKHAVFAPK